GWNPLLPGDAWVSRFEVPRERPGSAGDAVLRVAGADVGGAAPRARGLRGRGDRVAYLLRGAAVHVSGPVGARAGAHRHVVRPDGDRLADLLRGAAVHVGGPVAADTAAGGRIGRAEDLQVHLRLLGEARARIARDLRAGGGRADQGEGEKGGDEVGASVHRN